jgi:transcriptional antiterminator NusG
MDDQNLNWYALFVRSNHEFVMTAQLQRQGVEVFLPCIGRMRRWSDRDKLVQVPLFPGYLFVHVPRSAEVFLRILRWQGAISFVTQEPGKPVPVDAWEMESLRVMLQSGTHLDVYPHLCEGTRVLVTRGPLMGAEGILMQKNKDRLFLVNINILGRSVGTRIDADDLEVLLPVTAGRIAATQAKEHEAPVA